MRRPFAALRALSCIVFGGLLIASQTANAALTLKLEQGASSVIIVDGGAGDVNPVVGAVTFIGAVGVFTLNVSTGLSKPILGGPSLAHMDLNSLDTSTTGAGTLIISLTDTDFSLEGATGFGSLGIGGTVGTGASLTAASFLDPLNAEFGTTVQIGGLLGPFGPGPFAGSTGSSLALVDPFSLTSVVTITHPTGITVTSFNAETQVSVPEPTTLTLLGGGLLGLGFFARRLRRRSSASGFARKSSALT